MSGGKTVMGWISEREKRPIHDGQMCHDSHMTDRPTAITVFPPINTSVASCASALAKCIPSHSQRQRKVFIQMKPFREGKCLHSHGQGEVSV